MARSATGCLITIFPYHPVVVFDFINTYFARTDRDLNIFFWQRIRVASVEIRPEWTPLDGTAGLDDFTMSLTSMEKLSARDEPQASAVIGCLSCKIILDSPL